MYLDYRSHKAGVYVIDIEADSLDPTIVWCLCWENVLTGYKGECTNYEEISKFFEDTVGGLYVGHNIIKYDGPVLSRLCGAPLSVANCIDTLILSTLYSPSIQGGHSLDAWGERLGKPKIEFSDWSRLTKKMVEYCHQDVSITAVLFRRLIKTLNDIWLSPTTNQDVMLRMKTYHSILDRLNNELKDYKH